VSLAPTGLSAIETPPLAPYGRRVAAALIDVTLGFLLPSIAAAVLIVSLTDVDTSEPGQTGIGFILLPIVPLYSALLHRFWHGQTLGKRLFGIAVRRVDGSQIDFAQSYGRSITQFLLLIFWVAGLVDSLWPLWQERRRSLHDLAAGTIVVSVRGSLT
jgi:eukaryotic-like serine/threonine-protein kinase